ncbi:serine protease, partial [Streptomyces durbertensis]|nr:serine protease [Streptomyces durbertensis]
DGPPAPPIEAPPPHHADPDVVARLARAADRPLLVVLDAPEEMPPHLSHAPRPWALATAAWLRASGARLALGCRPEFWERLGPHFPAEVLHRPTSPFTATATSAPAATARREPDTGGEYLPPHVPLADPPEGHPLTLRILEQLQPVAIPATPPGRHEVFEAWLALVSLRIATSVGAGRRPAVRGSALRRLAAVAAGRLHLAARRCLGPGRGALDQRAFETVFPWHGGWAGAVLSLDVLQPAGEGYRFTDEEFGDWLQGVHLELDEALANLVHSTPQPGAVPVPGHRVGPVAEALLLAHHHRGAGGLLPRLRELVDAVHREGEQGWWAARLLSRALRGVPDATPYLPVLRALAARLLRAGSHPDFPPAFWAGLRLPLDARTDLLRQLLPLDPAQPGGRRFLDVAAALLTAEPAAAQPLLCRWFGDDRPLRAPGATVATAAGALLHTHRGQATDSLTEALVAALTTAGGAHAGELLDELAHDEPAALSRAVHRWAADDRVERRRAAAGRLAALATVPGADHDELTRAAKELLRRPDDTGELHPPAYGHLLGRPASRSSYLTAALLRFARDPYDAGLSEALVRALSTHPRQVLAGFRHRLCGPAAASRESATALLTALADVRVPALARQVAHLVAEYAWSRPEEVVEPVTAFVERRLAAGAAARATLLPLVEELCRLPGTALRARLGRVLAAADGQLAGELLEPLLAAGEEPPVRESVLAGAGHDPELLRRLGLATDGTPPGTPPGTRPRGAAGFDGGALALPRKPSDLTARTRG